jgi:regulator of protease activity HflC (stomatin/prohibitin superfamily)
MRFRRGHTLNQHPEGTGKDEQSDLERLRHVESFTEAKAKIPIVLGIAVALLLIGGVALLTAGRYLLDPAYAVGLHLLLGAWAAFAAVAVSMYRKHLWGEIQAVESEEGELPSGESPQEEDRERGGQGTDSPGKEEEPAEKNMKEFPPGAARGTSPAGATDGESAPLPETLYPFNKTAHSLYLAVAAAFTGILVTYFLLFRPPPVLRPDKSVVIVSGIASLLLAFSFFVVARYLKSLSPDELPEAESLTLWLRNGQWVSIAGGVALILLYLQYLSAALWIEKILFGWALLLSAELLLQGVAFALRAPPELDRLKSPIGLFLLGAIFSRENPLSALIHSLEEYFHVDIRSSTSYRTARRWSPVLCLLLIFVFWGMTSLVVIQPEEQGILEQFGRLKRPVLEPGLHAKLPWPFETVRRYPVRRIQSLTVGFVSTGEPQDFIWTRAHGREEHRFVVGEGRELISIDAILLYRIRDLVQYAYRVQNPLDALEVLAYRVLMRESVPLTLDELLVRDRAQFSRRLRDRLQIEVDDLQLGIEIIEVDLKSIHPPLQVAAAYQRVVSSTLEKEAEILGGKAYRERTLPAARSQGKEAIAKARAAFLLRVATARGAAQRFEKVAHIFRKGPDLFKKRRRMEALEEALKNRKLVIIDDRLFEGEIESWLDMRTMRGSGGSRPGGSNRPSWQNREKEKEWR